MENSNVEIIKMKELPKVKVSEVTPDLPAPPEGKVWRRSQDGLCFYGSVVLGELHFLDGKELKKTIKEKPEDYELVDIESFLKLPDQF